MFLKENSVRPGILVLGKCLFIQNTGCSKKAALCSTVSSWWECCYLSSVTILENFYTYLKKKNGTERCFCCSNLPNSFHVRLFVYLRLYYLSLRCLFEHFLVHYHLLFCFFSERCRLGTFGAIRKLLYHWSQTYVMWTVLEVWRANRTIVSEWVSKWVMKGMVLL